MMLLVIQINGDVSFEWQFLRYVVFDSPSPELLATSSNFEDRYLFCFVLVLVLVFVLFRLLFYTSGNDPISLLRLKLKSSDLAKLLKFLILKPLLFGN